MRDKVKSGVCRIRGGFQVARFCRSGGVVMRRIQPTKEQVRVWLNRRREKPERLPDIEQIRRQVGWTVAEDAQDLAAAIRTAGTFDAS